MFSDKDPKNEIDIRSDVECCISDAIEQCTNTINHIDKVIPQIDQSDYPQKQQIHDSLFDEKQKLIGLRGKLQIILPMFEWEKQELQEKVF